MEELDIASPPTIAVAAAPLSPTIRATGEAVVSAAGTVTAVRIIDAGAGI